MIPPVSTPVVQPQQEPSKKQTAPAAPTAPVGMGETAASVVVNTIEIANSAYQYYNNSFGFFAGIPGGFVSKLQHRLTWGQDRPSAIDMQKKMVVSGAVTPTQLVIGKGMGLVVPYGIDLIGKGTGLLLPGLGNFIKSEFAGRGRTVQAAGTGAALGEQAYDAVETVVSPVLSGVSAVAGIISSSLLPSTDKTADEPAKLNPLWDGSGSSSTLGAVVESAAFWSLQAVEKGYAYLHNPTMFKIGFTKGLLWGAMKHKIRTDENFVEILNGSKTADSVADKAMAQMAKLVVSGANQPSAVKIDSMIFHRPDVSKLGFVAGKVAGLAVPQLMQRGATALGDSLSEYSNAETAAKTASVAFGMAGSLDTHALSNGSAAGEALIEYGAPILSSLASAASSVLGSVASGMGSVSSSISRWLGL